MASIGAEIANAFVTLRVKMPGVQKDIAGQLGGVDVSGIGSDIGRKLSESAGKGFDLRSLQKKFQDAGRGIGEVGSKLTKNITTPAAVAGGAVATLVGALGFKRLIGIDTARGQFKGLGHDADEVMKQVDKGVTDTALSMAEGASIAVGILATGNLPMQELEAQIKRVANVSAAYGVDASQAGYLLNNVLTKNKVTYGDLSQMVQNQIPIISQLADYYGVTGDEIAGMAQRGEISIEDFNTVLDNNAGAAAEEYANTWQGVTSNIMSNIGRLGAEVLDKVFPQMKEQLQGFLEMLRSDEAKAVMQDIGQTVSDVFTNIVDAIKGAVEWWNNLSPTVQKALGIFAGVLVVLGPVLIIVGKIAAGIGALIGVAKTVITVVKAGAAAFKILNAVMAANPIMAILTVVALLVGALIWFFTETELGQKIWGEFTRFLGEAWENIKNFFVAVWENHLKPVFDAIGAIFKWLWENIIQPIVKYIEVAIQVWGAIFKWLWENAIKPAFDAIGAIFKWIWEKVISPVVDWIAQKIEIFKLAVKILWEQYVKPAFEKIGEIFRWIWDNVIKPVIDWVKGKLDEAGLAFEIMRDIIGRVWDRVSSVIRTGWDTIKGIIDKLIKFVKEEPKKAFESARDAIGDAWKGIQDLAKKPVRFVIETVINGLIDTVNKIPGVNLSKLALPPGFFEGGYTGALPANAVAGVVHGDEHVIRSASRRRIESRHPGLLDHMNRFGEVPGYKSGGWVVPLPKGSFTISQPFHAGHNGIDLAAATGTKIMAARSGIATEVGWGGMGGNEIRIAHPDGYASRYSHLSRFAIALGQEVKQGQKIGEVGSTGYSTGPHLHYMVHRPPGGWSTYTDPAPYMGVFSSGWNPLDGLMDWAVNKFKESFPGSDMWIDAAGGMLRETVKGIVSWGNDKQGKDNIGATLFDDGGWLDPGKHFVENRTGRPEPILTGAQWDTMRRAADRPTAVFVQNPFTGEYLLGEVDERAQRVFEDGMEPFGSGAVRAQFGGR